jgi:uncharacterized protein (DUF433 family)
MKRSEVVKLIANWAKPEILNDVYSHDYQEWADNLLHTLTEEYGLFGPDSIPNEDGTITSFFEPEEGWDEYLRFKEPPRTLPTSSINRYLGKPTVSRRHEMAIMWNNGSTIEDIAAKFNVTRTRVETCLKLVERQMNKETK